MTDSPLVPEPAAAPTPRPARRRRRWPWALGSVAVLLVLLLALPTLLGGTLLASLGGAGIQAERVGGPLWAPRIEGATVRLPGVSGKAEKLSVDVAGVDLARRTVKLNVRAVGADVDLRLRDLFRGGGQGGSGGGGWKVALGALDVQRSTVTVNGQGFNVPDGRFAVSTAPDGRVLVRGRTPNGELNADARVEQTATGQRVSLDLDADARVINHYWPGVTAGRIGGRYVLGDGPVRGDLTLRGGAVRVPQAPFVVVRDIGGTVTHRGEQIDLKLAGQGWDGPVTATGRVDYGAKNWAVTAVGRPTVSGLAQALGTTGKGTLNLTVRAEGWSGVHVTAAATGAGTLAGIGFSGARANYSYRRQPGEPGNGELNELTFAADTALAGSPQKLAGRWAFGKSGQATLAGSLGRKALDLNATISADNVLSIRGQALGGPAAGTLALRGLGLNAVLNPTYGAVKARVALSGVPQDLRAVVTDGVAGPFPLAGTARLNKEGLSADLGTARLKLDRGFRGGFELTNLQGAGLTLNGSGTLALTEGDVRATVAVRAPGVQTELRGPLNLNYLRQQGTFTAGAQSLRWQGDAFVVRARGLPVAGGLNVDGDLTVTTTLKAFGTARARGAGLDLRASASGSRALVRGTARGVGLQADVALRAPYRALVRLPGSGVRADVALAQGGGATFALTTGRETARGVYRSLDDLTATGAVDLAALRPLLGADVSGRVALNLAGRTGGATVNARVNGADVAGTLTRRGTAINANVTGGLSTIRARLAGQVYPDVRAAGTVTGYGQTLPVSVAGPYSALNAVSTGRTAPLTLGGVTLPAQNLRLSATLTPALRASGRWGNLDLAYRGGEVRVAGRQTLVALGRAGEVRGTAAFAPGWRGRVDASARLDTYSATVAGPWSALRLALTDAATGLSATGTAGLPAQTYDLSVRGPLLGGPGRGGVLLAGRVSGRGATPAGRLTLTDGAGGSAALTLRGLDDFALRSAGLTLAGQPLRGELRARNGVLDGTLRAGPLDVVARNGAVRAGGVIAGQTVDLSGRVALPATVSDLRVSVSGPYGSATAAGDLDRLRGTLTLRPQTFGASPARLTLPPQRFALRASPRALSAQIGGLTYQGGRWTGALDARYAFATLLGTLRLVGTGSGLDAVPAGPLTGRVALLPALGGELRAGLSPLAGALPDAVRNEVVPGTLVARLNPNGAVLNLVGSRYAGAPLTLDARVGWRGALTASGTLSQPGTRLPVAYADGVLRVSGATLDGRALRPFLADASGRATVDLTLPVSDFSRARGRAALNLRGGGGRAVGRLTLAGGQLSADLTSTLGGADVRVQGPLYPRADATLRYGTLTATLRGEATGTLNLRATGTLAGRPVDVLAQGSGLTGTRATVAASGTVAGAALNLALTRGTGAGLAGWAVTGRASTTDLRPLAGVEGTLSAQLSGTLANLRAVAAGRVAGVAFSAPLRYAGGVLRAENASAQLAQGTVRASGPLFPRLALSAKATLTDVLPGTYTATVGGTFARPDVRAAGRLTTAVQGLQAAGTTIRARLFGRDWRADLSGAALSGTLRGQLNSGTPGGLQDVRLALDTAYATSGTDLRLRGTPSWNLRRGFGGSLRAVGELAGQPLDALLDGGGDLRVAATYGTGTREARVTGTLDAAPPLRPGGRLDLAAFDVGGLWGRPQQLRLTGRATLAGKSWSAPEAAFAGQVADTAGELSGDLGLTYRAGDVSARLAGPNVAGGGTLRGGAYDVNLRAGTVRLARLLPPGLAVDALTFAGRAEARGTLAGGPQRLALNGVQLRGEQRQVGPFALYGSASYGPGGLSAQMDGALRGGVLSARGALPSGLRLTVRDLATDYIGATSLGRGTLNAGLTLRGEVADPVVEGRVNLLTDQLDAALSASGRVRSPHLFARTTLKGSLGGTVYADLRDLDLTRGSARARLYGTLAQGETSARLDLAGVWPNLAGQVSARVAGVAQPLALTGDGRGGYALNAGALGSGRLTLRGPGFVPALDGTLSLNPLALAPGATGTATVTATLGGTLAAPRVAGLVQTRGAGLGGVTLADTAGTLGLDGGTLAARLTQGGAEVAVLSGQTVTLSGLRLDGLGTRLNVSGTAGLNGTANLTLGASGTLSGTLAAQYRARALNLTGQLAGPQNLAAALDLRADPLTGWHGTARVTGGPAGVFTAPLALTASGRLASPLVQGEGGLLGAGVRLVAAPSGVNLRLVDGPGASASGALDLRPNAGVWTLGGAVSLTRPELGLTLTPSGPVSSPSALLSLRRGEWRAAGTVSPTAADLSVSDGERAGRVTYGSGEVRADLPGLRLSRLDIAGLDGTLTARGALTPQTGTGSVRVDLASLRSPYSVPYLGLPLDGDVGADLTLQGGKLAATARATLSSGTLNLNAAQGDGGRWTGRVTGALRKEAGTLNLDLTASASGVQGRVGLSAFPADALGQRLTVGGDVTLSGQTFQAALRAASGAGAASVDASGGLADLVPSLSTILAVRPTGEGYDVRAVLDELEVSTLKLAPQLSGRLSGTATLRDGGGTFVLSAPALRVGPQTLATRVEGTQVDGDWRLRGFLGDSQFTAGLSGGEVFGQGSLRALPIGAVIGAATGTTPGEGVVTGVARFRFPLADPLAGRATLVAERIRVSATRQENGGPVTETLLGSGTLDFEARELRSVNIQLAGAGTWDVRGQYTRQRVDLTAAFTDTTFTPVLQLVPALTDLGTTLKGTLVFTAAGTYERPRGLLRARGLRGTVAGLSIEVPAFAGDLPDSGAFTAGGTVRTGGTVAADGRVDVRGQLSSGRLSGTVASFAGLLAPEALGPLPNTTATLSQTGATTWGVDVQSRTTTPSAGTLRLSGQIAPRWDLTLSARNYNLPVSAIYSRESAITGDLRAVDDGAVIRVTGAADIARLLLGRVNAPATIPAPGQSTTGNGNGRGTDTYPSPLPEVYTTFPPRTPAGEDAPAAPRARPFLERIVFDDIPVRAPSGIRIDENLARAEFGGGLVLSGTGARPLLSGAITAQRGSVFLRENEFTITSGRVAFDGNSPYPAFTLAARGNVDAALPNTSATRQTVPVGLNISGQFVTRDTGAVVLDLDTTLTCAAEGPACADPATGVPYSEAELYALVATGVPNLTALRDNLGTLGSSALQTALNVFVLGEVERTIARTFGLDVFRFTPQFSTTDGTFGATVTLGSYVTRNLYLQYQVDLTGAGTLDATYNTPDDRFTFRVSTPLTGLNLQSLRPSFSAAYNLTRRTSVSLGVESVKSPGVDNQDGTRVRFGITYRFFSR